MQTCTVTNVTAINRVAELHSTGCGIGVRLVQNTMTNVSKLWKQKEVRILRNIFRFELTLNKNNFNF